MSSTEIPKVVPAQLSFLAIYNPTFGTSDETFHDQIVFYYSKAARARSKLHGKDSQAARQLREEENEKLRQVGLAQGMVSFARSFSAGQAVDSVETEKSRIIIHELEKDWWILASIDLTKLPVASTSRNGSATSANNAPAVDYSSREVSPPMLLIQQLIRAHAIFLLHHGGSLDDLFRRLRRQQFCNTLERYWNQYASRWDVMLHGSPAVDVYNGMKLAAGGELGIGVGEEEWGSGEREVLEDFVRKTNGLVDLVVSRYGEASPQQTSNTSKSKMPVDASSQEPWLGHGSPLRSSDGVLFSGTGALSRKSLRDISIWVESIYRYGDHAYGVQNNPTSDRRKRRRKNAENDASGHASAEANILQGRSEIQSTPDFQPRIPPPIVTAVESSLDKASKAVDADLSGTTNEPQPFMASLADTETWMKYLTLGYGTSWGGKGLESIGQERPADEPQNHSERIPSPEPPMRFVEPEPTVDRIEEKIRTQVQSENSGYFIIGLKGDMQNEDIDDENTADDWNNRTMLRTLHVEVMKGNAPETPQTESEQFDFGKEIKWTDTSKHVLTRLRPVVYVHRPFIYTFLFKQRTDALNIAPFYRNLHIYFSPLHRPMSNSSAPDRVAARIAAASSPTTTVSTSVNSAPNMHPIYDIVYDPRTLTVHSTIPNIPDPGSLSAEGLGNSSFPLRWSRVEALNVHSQILSTVASTRRNLNVIDETCKTNRGWWLVWMRLPPSQSEPLKDDQASTVEYDSADLCEAFLVRRAREPTSTSTQSQGNRFGSGMWRLGGQTTEQKMGGATAGWGPKGLAEGIGVDARRYAEGLLSLNR
ncbi:hypothetical protein EJ04DRAFT_454895 [Polyplosphaeria fusca]|uniref:CCZ1/INTU/HSP4 first Longin domain-containing protein n=1 Tax=Polyplosphaeria fusca TaxID=682080 RepID=A0A9P4RC14_9PLEO|nr:hypothetical protein EJ04DRAFT_454895 [Polyplosphaeria fusca]